jgi:chromosome segregation ATPase
MSTTQMLLAQNKALLRQRMTELRGEIAALMAKSAPAQARLDSSIEAQNKYDQIIADLAAEVDTIEQPHLHALKMELAAVARAEIATLLTAE